jgi:hypothetical protein
MDGSWQDSLSLEIIAEIFTYLDYVDQENAHYSCRTFYHARSFALFPAIHKQIEWLKRRENLSEIPRQELLSHNAFLRILTRTFSVTRPSPYELDALVTFFSQELISAWLVPMNQFGAEIRINDSLHDTRIYHQRYPLLRRLAMILRWNNVGFRIAKVIEEWLDLKWATIHDDDEIQALLNLDYTIAPPNVDLLPHQIEVLHGFEFLALHPIQYYSTQSASLEEIGCRQHDAAWAHPAFDRLKLWLSIPELWNIEVRHLEIKYMYNPWRPFRRIAQRPSIHLVLYKCAQYRPFALRLLNYVRSVELSTPYPDLIQGSVFWYEEGFCGSVLWWAFHNMKFVGQDISLFKRPFVDLIRCYICVFGPITISDLILNIVFMVQRKTLPIRMIVARTVMIELLYYGYEFLTDAAKEAVVNLMRDENGRLVTRQVRIDYAMEEEGIRGEPRSGS